MRVGSYFDNSELQAGLPQGRELEILNEVKSEVPPEVFTTECKNPVNATPGGLPQPHARGVQASRAKPAGRDPRTAAAVLTNAQAASRSNAEFLLRRSRDFERIVAAATSSISEARHQGLRPHGRQRAIQAPRRRATTSTSSSIRSRSRISPGNEQRDFWGSPPADQAGSRNTAGIKNPAVDKLIDKIVFAKDREELVAATHALDRVLLWNYYVVPQWSRPAERVATWDMFGRPAKLPSQTSAAVAVGGSTPTKQKALTPACTWPEQE